MRNDFNHLEDFRIRTGSMKTLTGDHFGAFSIPFQGRTLTVIASDGTGLNARPVWEHVSISLPNRCPNWPETCMIKGLFWGDDETVIQFHPDKAHYINNHPYCLHLWRNADTGHELPAEIYVGIQGVS